MSMDSVFEQASALAAELKEFNGQLRQQIQAIGNSHTDVSPLWADAMRRNYDRKWAPLEAEMQEYLVRIGPGYVDFMAKRLEHLNAYLHGS